MLRSPVIQELKISSWSNIILAHNCKCELLMWKANNNTHGKYCTQTIPVSFNSLFGKTSWKILYTWDFDSLIKSSKTNNTPCSLSLT